MFGRQTIWTQLIFYLITMFYHCYLLHNSGTEMVQENCSVFSLIPML